ncbi:MAG: TIGR00304 family membrane protein [Thermoproteota archaeon]
MCSYRASISLYFLHLDGGLWSLITTRERCLKLGFRLIILGFALSFIGFILLAISAYRFLDSSTSAGIVIFIGPIPILLGSGPHGSELIAVCLLIALTILIFAFLISRSIERDVSKEPISVKMSN